MRSLHRVGNRGHACMHNAYTYRPIAYIDQQYIECHITLHFCSCDTYDAQKG